MAFTQSYVQPPSWLRKGCLLATATSRIPSLLPAANSAVEFDRVAFKERERERGEGGGSASKQVSLYISTIAVYICLYVLLLLTSVLVLLIYSEYFKYISFCENISHLHYI